MRVPFPKTRSAGPLPALDHAYQRQLAALSQVRRATAAAATTCKRLELELGQVTERGAGGHDETPRPDIDPQIEALRRRYAAARESAPRLFAANQRLQVRIEEFRLAKEAAEAAYAAAQDALDAAQAETRAEV